MVMKTLWGPLLGVFLLPALYSVQRPTEPMETAPPPVDDSIPHQTRNPAETVLVFPDYVDGGGWTVQLALSNVVADTPAEVAVDVYDQDGRPILDLFDSGSTFEIPPQGSRVLRSVGSGTIRRGWIQVRSDTGAVSGLLTYRQGATGIEVGVAPVELGDRFALFVEESGDVGAGVAIFKPDASPGLELRIRDEEGNDPLEGMFLSWGDFQRSARTLPEWLGVEGADAGFPGDIRGLLFLRTENDSPFAPLGLRSGKRSHSLSSVPAIQVQTREPSETTLIFPDYVDGGGWTVQLALSNVGADTAAEVVVDAYDQDGRPILDLFDSGSTFEIPPLGSRVLRSTGTGAIRRGWIEVETDGPSVVGLLTYRQTETGIEVSVEPVELGTQFALFAEESSVIGTGLAIFKPDVSSRIELRIRDEDGNDPLDEMFLPWRGFHQAARTLPEWFDVEGVETGFLRDFRGLLFLRTEDESGFAPLGLRFGKGTSSLSAVPAIRIPDGGGIDGGQAPPPTVTLSASPSSIDRGQSHEVDVVVHECGERRDHPGHWRGADVRVTKGVAERHDDLPHHGDGSGRTDGHGIGDGYGGRFRTGGAGGVVRSPGRVGLDSQRQLADGRPAGGLVRGRGRQPGPGDRIADGRLGRYRRWGKRENRERIDGSDPTGTGRPPSPESPGSR